MTAARTQHAGTVAAASPAALIPKFHRRHVLCGAGTALAMLLVGLFVAAVGVLVLNVSGGAAPDTTMVIMVAAFGVTDFWGGAIVSTLTRLTARETMILWTIVRSVLLLIIGTLVLSSFAIVPVQILLATGASYVGAKFARKQALLRTAARR